MFWAHTKATGRSSRVEHMTATITRFFSRSETTDGSKRQREDREAKVSPELKEFIEEKRQNALKKLRANNSVQKAPIVEASLTGNEFVDPTLPDCWKTALKEAIVSPKYSMLYSFLGRELASSKKIFPPMHEVYRAFELCPLNKVRVVILGQDPYHNVGQANGLAFSVRKGIPLPASLVNIFKELKNEYSGTDTPFTIPCHGELEAWAKQGVLLLNTCLTVRAHEAFSHKGRGWEEITNAAIDAINALSRRTVFLLWGKPAQEKGKRIDKRRHFVLTAPHPSPLSAHRGFFGCNHFRKANEELIRLEEKPIDWRL